MKWLLLLLATAPIFPSSAALALDPRTHVWVSQQVLNDVAPDGKLTIGGHEYVVPDQVVQAMRLHPEAYRMGNVGPDAHPDLIVGQSFLHPGTGGGWQADDWGKWIQDRARQHGSREAIAYSAGYWGHVAGDVIAHSYVNTYAGDYFLLYGEQEVELRHFVLEHYIGDRTPLLKDHLGNELGGYQQILRTPSEFLTETLVLNDVVAEQYLKSPVLAAHLLAMYRLHKSVHDLRVVVEEFEGPLSSKLDEIDELGKAINITLDETIQKLAELTPTLEPLVQQVNALKAAVDAQREANKPIEDAASAGEKAVINAEDELAKLERQIRGIVGTLENRVKRSVSRLERGVAKLEGELQRWKDDVEEQTGLVEKLKGLKSHWSGEVSRLEDKLTRWIRHVPGLGDAKRKLDEAKKELSNAEENLRTAADNVHETTKELERERARLAAAIKERADFESQVAMLNAAKDVASGKLQQARDAVGALSAQLQSARAAMAEKVNPWELASQQLDRLQSELQRLEDQRDDFIAQIREYAQQLRQLTNLQNALFLDPQRAVVGLLREWENDLVRATVAYIDAASATLLATMTPNGDPLKPMKEWFECWAPVFSGVPSAVPSTICRNKAYLRDWSDRMKEMAEELAMKVPLVRDLVTELTKLRERIKEVAVDAAIELSDHIFGEAFTKFHLVHNKHYSDSDLNSTFANDSSGKQLLVFDNFSKIIRADLGMVGDDQYFDPETFPPAIHAVTLAKLALLDVQQINALAANYGMTAPTAYAAESSLPERAHLLYPDESQFTNILYRGVRSIDGNQQWRGIGLPYIRRNGTFENTKGNKFGYCFNEDSHTGFRMWVDSKYRTDVFAKLFPGELKLASLAPGIAPFIPEELKELEKTTDSCSIVSGDAAELPKAPLPPQIRETAEREALERERSIQVEEVPAVRLLDRVDGKDREQVLGALREEIRKEILDELRNAQQWGDDYARQREMATKGGKPLLLVFEGIADAQQFKFDDMIGGELQAKLLEPFVLCKVGVDAQASKRILARCRYSQLPLILLVEPKTERIVLIQQGPFDHTTWATLLINYARNARCAR